VRELYLGALCLGLMAGCAATDAPGRSQADLRRIEAEFDRTWEAALRTLSERGFGFELLEQRTGEIRSGWLVINPDFEATVVLTKMDDRYSSCGRPAVGQAYRAKEVKLHLTLRRGPRGSTGFRVEAQFQTRRHRDLPMWGEGDLGPVPCASRGRLEDEIWAEVQLRAVSGQLERLRKGLP
jgi:hypothetical protein